MHRKQRTVIAHRPLSACVYWPVVASVNSHDQRWNAQFLWRNRNNEKKKHQWSVPFTVMHWKWLRRHRDKTRLHAHYIDLRQLRHHSHKSRKHFRLAKARMNLNWMHKYCFHFCFIYRQTKSYEIGARCRSNETSFHVWIDLDLSRSIDSLQAS